MESDYRMACNFLDCDMSRNHPFHPPHAKAATLKASGFHGRMICVHFRLILLASLKKKG